MFPAAAGRRRQRLPKPSRLRPPRRAPTSLSQGAKDIMGPSVTVEACLAKIGLTPAQLARGGGLDEEWSIVKRAYFKAALKVHPDKGGDAAAFRTVQSAFDSLRGLYDGAAPSFLFSTSASASSAAPADYDPSINSWEFYAEAAQEVVPMYRVERAKSSRGRCSAKGAAKHPQCNSDDCIEKDSLRVGWMNSESGTYGGWVHLKCWRVPNRVWLGLPNPSVCEDLKRFVSALRSMSGVLLSGINELSPSEMRQVAMYCTNRANWARRVALQDRPAATLAPGASAASGTVARAQSSSTPTSSKALVASTAPGGSSSALVDARRFVIPVPGRDGPANSLAGKTVVLSGLFPEVGGGKGLSLGKDRTTAMLERFGARVTSAVSGRTDVLLIGKEPGFAKVSKAQVQGTAMLSLEDMRQGLVRGSLTELIKMRRRTPVAIEDFSSGDCNHPRLLLLLTPSHTFSHLMACSLRTSLQASAAMGWQEGSSSGGVGRRRSCAATQKHVTRQARWGVPPASSLV